MSGVNRSNHLASSSGQGSPSAEQNRNRRAATPFYLKLMLPVWLLVAVICCWQLAVNHFDIPKTILPAPGAIWDRILFDLTNSDLINRALITLWEAIIGCGVATAIAVPFGYLIARWRLVEAAFSPFIAASQAIPGIAIAPLLVIWVGYGLKPIVILCAVMVFFPIVLAARLGFLSAEKELLEAAQLDGASGWQLLCRIQFPLAMPALMTGLRNGFTLSVTGAVVGEFVMGGEGLGMTIAAQSANIDTAGLFSTITVVCLLAIFIYLFLMVIEKVTDPLAPKKPSNSTGLFKNSRRSR